MAKPIADQVVVITGASHGIGRETALQFVRKGASVVAAARDDEALQELVAEVDRLGGQAEAVVTDVADYAQVERLAQRAVDRFGRIDTWVNNAAVSVYGTVEQLDADEMDRVVRVDLLGQMFGAKAALPHLRQSRGTLIHVGSSLSQRAIPLQAAYVASKHGVKGFTEALRLEMAHENSGVEVVLILPSSINTPLFGFARSKLGVRPQPVPPVYEPRVVADAILHAAQHGGREIVVGGWGKLLIAGQRLSPTLLDRYMLQDGRMFKQQRTDEPDNGQDNLFRPSTGSGSTTGDFGESSKSSSLYTTLLELHPNRKRALAAGLLLIALMAIRRSGR
jgi:NAD(P)-dependent dehydrogenase (short-subunit alcohol dehydrogenase family)